MRMVFPLRVPLVNPGIVPPTGDVLKVNGDINMNINKELTSGYWALKSHQGDDLTPGLRAAPEPGERIALYSLTIRRNADWLRVKL